MRIFLAILALGVVGYSFVLKPKTRIRPDLSGAGKLKAWTLDGSGSWMIRRGILQLFKAGNPGGSIRRPAALAILKSASFEKVTLKLELRSTTGIDVARRDVDLVVGYESPSRFYYIHLSALTDEVHNGIFLVDHADRKRIDSGKGAPKLTDQNWHTVRVIWNGVTGLIEVYFDGSNHPILSTVDTRIRTGRVGVGSFDDTAEFRNIEVISW